MDTDVKNTGNGPNDAKTTKCISIYGETGKACLRRVVASNSTRRVGSGGGGESRREKKPREYGTLETNRTCPRIGRLLLSNDWAGDSFFFFFEKCLIRKGPRCVCGESIYCLICSSHCHVLATYRTYGVEVKLKILLF
ncbi:hypothetical protein EVAR_24370_1 [Eumeta japonica]|uniref:Uncharacterized protein n=1 Tax=Eumeta variegata TaxID=151549 RepID=A0A4C1YCT5_EUMVA|nr:hypothetical protein EVAR_24370_1 [Eumeta japonica]